MYHMSTFVQDDSIQGTSIFITEIGLNLRLGQVRLEQRISITLEWKRP